MDSDIRPNAYANIIANSEEITLLRQNSYLPFVIQVCFEVFQGANMQQALESEVLSAARSVQQSFNKVHGEDHYPRKTEDYLSAWTKNTDQSPAWFGLSRNDIGEPIISLLPATKNIMSFIEGMTINKSMVSVDVLNEFSDFISETADRISGRVDDRKAAIKAKMRKLQVELDALEDFGIAKLDDQQKKIRANKFRKMIIDIRTGVGEIPEALKQLSEQCFEVLFSEKSKGDILNEVGALRKNFRNDAPFKIMTTLRSTHLNTNKRVAMEADIRTVVDGVRDHLSIDDMRHSWDFFSHVINIGGKHLEREASYQAKISEFIRSQNFIDQQVEALLFRDAQNLFEDIAREIGPSLQDKRMDGVGLRYTDFGGFMGPEHTRRRLASGPVVPKEKGKHQIINSVDREKQSQELKERTARNMRMSRILSKEVIHARVAKLLEMNRSINMSEYLERYPLEFGLSEFHVILQEACKKLPARFIPGQTLKVAIIEGDKTRYLESADFEFLQEGEPGQGLQEFSMRFSDDQISFENDFFNMPEMT